MEKEIINSIINSLNENIKEKGSYAQFNDPSYEPIKISKDNFHEIKNISLNKKIAFIDGGNAEILKAPNFSLQLIRTYYTIYKENKRINSKKEIKQLSTRRVASKDFSIIINTGIRSSIAHKISNRKIISS